MTTTSEAEKQSTHDIGNEFPSSSIAAFTNIKDKGNFVGETE
jgi:hypothetical protein